MSCVVCVLDGFCYVVGVVNVGFVVGLCCFVNFDLVLVVLCKEMLFVGGVVVVGYVFVVLVVGFV